jgi:hypothetical protein
MATVGTKRRASARLADKTVEAKRPLSKNEQAKRSKKKSTAGRKKRKRHHKKAKVPVWCVCGHCVAEANPLKRVCCMCPPPACLSIVNGPAIVTLLTLHDAEIWQNLDLYPNTGPPANVLVMTNQQRRELCYRKLFRLLLVIGTRGVQVMLPSCCRAPINVQYPGP